jgi:hypothetical protein
MPTPDHKICIRGDGCSRVDLEQRQMTNEIHKFSWPFAVQELCAYGNAACLGPRKLMNGHQSEASHRWFTRPSSLSENIGWSGRNWYPKALSL